jgi:uncharacterized protein (DUF1501 family)
MLRLESDRGVQFCDGLTRRDFLRVGGLAVGLGLTELASLQRLGAAPTSSEKACIQLFLVGGPSHLDTWDLKPGAPDNIRGPFRPIPTNVPGIDICEHFPLMARMADRFALLRSIYHKEAPIHETGHQLMQTGYLFRGGQEYPHYGAVLSQLRPASGAVPPWVVLPGPIGNTGVSVSHGQTAGYLGKQFEPFCLAEAVATDPAAPYGLDPARLQRRQSLLDAVDRVQRGLDARGRDALPESAYATIFSPQAKKAFDLAAEPEAVRARYGWTTFGQSCLLARRLVQHGVRLVTVNMFDTVFGKITWDCHANGGDLNTTLDDYRDTLCPMLDMAYTALLDDLTSLGLLDNTLVLCLGEFGRTPKLNNRNGRDHWPSVWSGLMAGAGVRGGQVIGASDQHGEEAKDRPIHPSEIAASVYHALGIDLQTRLPGPDGRPMPLVEAKPVLELF